jgi:hypothetical protein
MTTRGRAQPGLTPQAEADRQSRLEREAAALRENLRRRKQARPSPPKEIGAGHSAGQTDDRQE